MALLDTADLRDVGILVIANAMHSQSQRAWAPLPNHSAFAPTEVSHIEAWVREGGSLLLIADHMPLAAHAETLAAAFGVRFYNGFAVSKGTRGGTITFRRGDASLRAGPITDGGGPTERVDSVTSFTGQAFTVDPEIAADAILTLRAEHEVLLPSVAWQFSDSTARVPGINLVQGVAFRHGQGRVAIFGEAAMFTAQLAGPNQVPIGMNSPVASQNGQFVLNLMHWLSGSAQTNE